MNRREFLQIASVTSLTWLFPGTRAWAFSNGKDDTSSKKLIVVLLRGGADGLNVVTPYGDPGYYNLRPKIALPRPGTDLGVIDLDGYFGAHPSLQPLMPLWQNKTLAFVHASGSPDPTRSHFDAQDYMESGTPGNKSVSSGWLNRLVIQLPQKSSGLNAISVGAVLPKICSGSASIATIAGAVQPQKSVLDKPVVEDIFSQLYSGNDELSRVFAEGLSAHKEVNEALTTPMDEGMAMEQKIANNGAPTPRNYAQFGKQISQLFRKSPSIQVAFLDFGGWDTHINQGASRGQLANHLTPLAQGLADLVSGLGDMYKDTAIVVQSEFGRTAKENGNGGTDHGHGNVMWVLGGDVPGGKVYGKWAGLEPNALHEQRDLPTSTDFRTVLGAVMNNHLGASNATIAKIFPGFAFNQDPFVQA
jgi:uncharacterized protein (DUF1501 family)